MTQTALINSPSHQQIVATLSKRYGPPSFCFFFGSHASARANASSDIDVIAVMSNVVRAFRETFSWNRFLFDAHVHDPETLHFMMRSEQREGLAILASKIDQALVLPAPCEQSSRLKAIAHDILRSGPPPQKSWDLPRRYLSAMMSDLERCADDDERHIIAMDLYVKTIEIYLRRHGRFSDRSRYLVRSVKELDPAFFGRVRSALAQLFQDGSVSPLTLLTREVLESIGGPLDAGYRQEYPERCRLALPPDRRTTV